MLCKGGEELVIITSWSSVTPETIPKLFCNTLLVAAKSETIINGFRKTGIYPLNPNVSETNDFVASDVTNSNEPATTSDNFGTLLETTKLNKPALEELTQSLRGSMKPDDIEEIQFQQTTTEELIASTSTSTPSLRP